MNKPPEGLVEDLPSAGDFNNALTTSRKLSDQKFDLRILGRRLRQVRP